jgi:hypothetical protein
MARFQLRLSLEADALSGGPEPFVAFMQMAHQFSRDAGDVDDLPFVYVLANEEQTEQQQQRPKGKQHEIRRKLASSA